MALHEPSARVVCRECEDQVAASRQNSNVTACRVGKCEAGGCAIPDVVTSTDDVKVMAVRMDGMRKLDDAGGLNPLVVPLL